ncbi:F-box/FBD/LRR-repeat protein At4g26340-like [Rutidosis leptorrhynchoides]|uniref:F-box/FBD/LRR-repeat protein At4g26340-like n=1 Tax=Rutidosis leptorrhynchoides TaxID=125765 RepID=UPI003A9A4A2A
MLPEEDVSRAYTLLKWINGVKSLALDEAMTYALSKFHLNNVPILPNLTRLHLKIPRLCDWTLLFNIIENSPNLQSLTIEKDCDHYDESSSSEMGLPQDFGWTEPNFPARCLESNLEEIILIGFFWMRCDKKAVKYLLDNAKVLKKFRASPHRLGLRKEGLFWMSIKQYAKISPCRYVVPKIDNLTGLMIVQDET